MGSLIASAIQGLVSGLLAPLTAWLQRRSDQAAGAQTQALADVTAANKDDVHAQSIDAGVAVDRASAVDDGLRKFSRPSE